MKKLILFVSIAVMGLLASCIDKNEEVDADSLPSWLHGSIYEELENPTQGGLTGTFTYYLRLVDDLDYAETLNRTGSKTVFPANDEAFAAFFADNDWGVNSYEDLTDSQKKLLLYTSMLDNAILLDMLSNVSNGSSEVSKGQAVKHVTALSVTDSVEYVIGQDNMPANNKYWTKYYDKGIYVVRDGTQPMMVHFTRSQMLNNNITTTGEGSDFEVLTGSPYEEGDTYIFDDKVIAGDITCQNGYIHQVQDVLLPPGNMAQVLRKNSETSLFSRIVDYFAAPYYNSTITSNYNSWAMTNGYETIDSIFEVRYLSSRSQAATLVTDPNNSTISSTQVLSYDPGWNQYYPAVANSTNVDITIVDIAAMFVPNDEAMEDYFLEGGNGAFLIDIYGDRDNTAENLEENLDSLHSKNPQVLTTFIKNLQKSSFVSTVPSKFTTIVNDATENMGMNMSLLDTNEDDGTYNIKIANNGVIYILNEMLAPDEYQAVLAPSSSYPDMQIMNWAVQDRTYLGVDFKYYLLAMSANYAFFIPDDEAFDLYYIDPVCYAKTQPEALHFYYDSESTTAGGMRCDRYYYDKTTQEIGERIGEATDYSRWSSQMIDILNYHTIVLDDGEVFGDNKYYKTKHGGELYVPGGAEVGDVILTGAHLDNGFPEPTIEVVYNEKNGNAYRMNRIIAPTMNSVSTILQSDERWSEFYEICAGSSATDLLAWAGISAEVNDFGTTDQDRYFIFTSTYGSSSSGTANACMDENVKMFNTYNYTLYAPNNEAMEAAYAAGLPRWSEIQEMFEKYDHDTDDISDEEQADMDKAYVMINIIREFVRYHFQTESMYADNTVESGNYKSMHTDDVGVAQELAVSGGGGYLYVTDGANITHTVDANSDMLVNKMARDYWFDATRQNATSIETSSFCAIHEISEAFMTEEQGAYGGYDEELAAAKAIKKAKQKYIRMSAYN